MARYSLHAYLVEVRRLNARRSDNLSFGSFDGKNNLRNALRDLLLKQQSYAKIPAFQKIFKIEKTWGNSGPLTGFVMAGDYGSEADIVSSSDGLLKYKKKKTEAAPEPFYFHIEVPDQEKRGIICLQQTGLIGIKGLFESFITGEFEKKHQDFRIHIRSLTMTDALQSYLKNGYIEEVIVEKHEIPSDIADRFGGTNKVYAGRFTYSIRPSKTSLFKKAGLIAFSKNQKDLDDVFDFGDIGYDIVKTKINIGGETKTINLTRPDNMKTSFDLTDDLIVGTSGHPTPASLKAEFSKIVSEIAKRGGIKL